MAMIILTTLHYAVCFGLILIVLLQAGKGGGLASAFGGGSSDTIFGSRRSNVLTRITAIGASIFMVTSLLLTIILPKQISVIQKKGVIKEEQIRDVKTPEAPGVSTSVPPTGQEVPGATPAEVSIPPKPIEQTEVPTPTPPQTQEQTTQPPNAPVAQPPAKSGKIPATPEGAGK